MITFKIVPLRPAAHTLFPLNCLIGSLFLIAIRHMPQVFSSASFSCSVYILDFPVFDLFSTDFLPFPVDHGICHIFLMAFSCNSGSFVIVIRLQAVYFFPNKTGQR